jgi:hypothetical protein
MMLQMNVRFLALLKSIGRYATIHDGMPALGTKHVHGNVWWIYQCLFVIIGWVCESAPLLLMTWLKDTRVIGIVGLNF